MSQRKDNLLSGGSQQLARSSGNGLCGAAVYLDVILSKQEYDSNFLVY